MMIVTVLKEENHNPQSRATVDLEAKEAFATKTVADFVPSVSITILGIQCQHGLPSPRSIRMER